MTQTKASKGALRKQVLFDVLNISHDALSFQSMTEFQNESLRSIGQLIGSSSSLAGKLHNGDQGLHFIDGAEQGTPEGSVERWSAEFQCQDPFLRSYMSKRRSENDHVVLSSDVIEQDKEDYLKSRFYNEHMRPNGVYHVMVIGLPSARGKPIGVIGLHRSQKEAPFTAEDAIVANLLAPMLGASAERIQLEEELACQTSGKEVSQEGDQEQFIQKRAYEFGLSAREVEIVSLMQKGFRSLEIAELLSISVRTVSNHLHSVFGKTGVHNRTALLYTLTN